jgi:hypothetical protein
MLHCNADSVIETTLSVCYALLIFDKSVFGFLQNGLATKVEKSRKQMKERKNRAKKIRGVKKVCTFALTRPSALILVCVWNVVVSLCPCGKVNQFLIIMTSQTRPRSLTSVGV